MSFVHANDDVVSPSSPMVMTHVVTIKNTLLNPQNMTSFNVFMIVTSWSKIGANKSFT